MRRWQTGVQLAEGWDAQEKADIRVLASTHVREWPYRFRDVY